MRCKMAADVRDVTTMQAERAPYTCCAVACAFWHPSEPMALDDNGGSSQVQRPYRHGLLSCILYRPSHAADVRLLVTRPRVTVDLHGHPANIHVQICCAAAR
eukprot:jgi/Ulvmu1/8717/UM047_0057.1